MADENKLLFTFEVDEKSVQKEMDKIKETGKDTASKLQAQFSAISGGGFFGLVAGVTLLNQGLELTKKIAGAIGDAFNAAVGTITTAEKIELINKQFDILSKVAVGAGTDLKDALVLAADGLVDTEDLLQATNKVLIDFKGNAADLPRIFEATRKITKITGGDLLQTFQDINQAIAAGNTRVLKQSGINIDATEIYKKYAASIGATADQLTEFQKRQALTASILNITEKQLAEISLSNSNATETFQRLSVQVGEVGDSLSILASKILKPAAVAIASFATSALTVFNENVIANFGSGAEKTAAQVSVLERDIKRLNETLAIQQQSRLDAPIIQETQARIKAAQDELKALQDITAKAKADAKAEDTGLSESAKAALDRFIPDPKEVAKRQAEFATAFLTAQQANLQLQIAGAQLETDEKTREDQLAKLRLGQIELEEQNHLAKLAALRNQFEIDKTLTQEQYNQLRNQENIRSQLQIESFEAQSNERKRKQAIDYQAKITSINTAIQNGILKVVSAAAERLGASLAKGGAAFADFQNVVLGIIGDLAISIGGTLVGIGLGIEAIRASILGLTGGPALAAGLALIALGGLLKSLSGGGSSSGADTGGSGGGIASTPSPGGIFTPEDEQDPQKPQQSIQVTVQGNILDRRQTGLELADVIREAFESQGTTIVGAV